MGKYLAAHLKEAHGTLVCRGTPVEKHRSKGSKIGQNSSSDPYLKLRFAMSSGKGLSVNDF